MNFIRFLIISICILYIFRFVVRLILPVLFQGMINKATQHGGAAKNAQPKRPEGKVQVEYMPPKEPSPLADKGEFVDYEEVK